jgi:hypothetical protein
MKEFKLHDKVRVLEMAIDGDVLVGTTDFITRVGSDGSVGVGNSMYNYFLGTNGGKLKLVKPELVKPEPVIKVGDIVELINGTKYKGKLRNKVKSISTCGKYLRVAGGDGWAIDQFKLAPCEYPNPPQMHQKEIIEWAKGAQIQYFSPPSEDWHYIDGTPKWYPKVRYRIKPDVPDVDPRLELLNEKIAELQKAMAVIKKEIGEL